MSLSVKKNIPWWGKIIAKILLSRLPIPYGLWSRLSLFRHGHMDNIDYVLGVFDSHVSRCGMRNQLAGKVILELGPGDSVATALVAAAYGAKAVLVDVGPYAVVDPRQYHQLSSRLRSIGLHPPDITGCLRLPDMLAACGARYLTEGLDSLREIDSESVDMIFSQAVLEHIRRHEFVFIQKECARILRQSGVCSHRVDLRDHLGGGLNNLRFSERVWESKAFVKSGFYTNRIQYGAMIELFQQAGFDTEITAVEQWESLPISRDQLAPSFRDIPDDGLRISGFDVLLHPSPECVRTGKAQEG